ncbi:MFS transporter [Catenulispora pinisilvae]|uniref:MFS transporter n=1 Tax=Catenulispora pinisilvae TaxID=2705253 RepID=UPI001891857F|nr:MFS transporter [Catenulispora pinisilvae]
MDRETLQRRRWAILGVLIFSLLVVVLDNTILNVALKIISQPKNDPHQPGLGASQSDLEWAINSYTLVFAGLLFTFGIVGDRFGRKKILMAGMVGFGIASVLCAYAGSPGALIVTRAAMGFFGAAIMPATLAIIANVFEPKEQPKAIGIWAGGVGLGVAIGPVLGGLLLDHFWWGSVFLINVPIIIIALIAMSFLVPDSKNPNPGRLDPLGVFLSMAGIVVFVYGIIRGGDLGWSNPQIWGTLAAGVVLSALFVYWELRTDHPALDVRLFRSSRPFSASVMLVGLSFFAMMGVLFFLSFYLQSVLNYSPLKAGLFLTPFALAQLIFSPLSARLVQRFGARAVSTFGMVTIGVTFLMYQFVNQTSAAWLLLLIFFLQGMGMANVMPPATTTIMTSLPREKAGVGSSVSNTVRQVGGALGVAVLGTLLTTAYRSRMEGPLKTVVPNPSALHDIDGSIQATKGAGEHLPALARFYPQADAAFIHAMHMTVTISAIVAFLAAIVSLTWLPRKASGAPAGPRRSDSGSDASAAAEAAGVA